MTSRYEDSCVCGHDYTQHIGAIECSLCMCGLYTQPSIAPEGILPTPFRTNTIPPDPPVDPFPSQPETICAECATRFKHLPYPAVGTLFCTRMCADKFRHSPSHAPACKEDAVNHPRHYRSHPSGIECIDIVEHLPFNIGNAIKYLWRSDHKGAQLEDLKKARWYIDREIQRFEKGQKT